jgi:hypothetical protein
MWSLNELLRNAVTDTNLSYSVFSPVPARFLKNVDTAFCAQHISVVHVVTAYWIHNFFKFKARLQLRLNIYQTFGQFLHLRGKGQTIAYNSSSVSRAALTQFICISSHWYVCFTASSAEQILHQQISGITENRFQARQNHSCSILRLIRENYYRQRSYKYWRQ